MAKAENKCPPVLTGQTLKNNTPELAKQMGLNQVCQKKANSEFATGSISGAVHIPFASLSAQASFTQSNNSMAQSGCGQFFLNAKNITDTVNNVSCSIKKNVTKSSTSVNSNASITISVKEGPVYQKYMDMLKDEQDKAQTLQNNLKMAEVLNAKNLSVAQINAINAGMSEQINNLIKLQKNVNKIQHSTFDAKAGGTIITNISVTDDQKQQLTSHYKAIANAVAQNNIQSHLGDQAMDPNTKSVVEQNINNKTNNINSLISTIINSATLNVNSNSSITINSNIPVDIENVTFDANALVNIAVSHISNNAISDGISAANDVLAKAASSTSAESSSAGVDALAKQLGKINKEAIGAAGGGLPWYAYLALAIIVLFLVFGGMFAIKHSKNIKELKTRFK